MSEQTRLSEENLAAYLHGAGLLPAGASVSVEPAGDGNINWVRRVREEGTGKSIVVKQARPALERFPEYQVPTERIVYEARYYEHARRLEPTPVCPRVLHFDERERVMVLEDLGDAERLDFALARGREVDSTFRTLGAFLGAIHRGTEGRILADEFPNDAMRRLHGDHIFHLPLRPNDFPLSETLRSQADALAEDRDLVAIADACYAQYLEPKGALVHGDVQAGNVLLAPGGPKLLDAEIAHVGDPAFDVGTLIAHALLASVASGRPHAALGPAAAAWGAYRRVQPEATRFAETARYAGLEMLRRTIGAARVAAVQRDDAGLAVLGVALRLIRTPPESPAGLV